MQKRPKPTLIRDRPNQDPLIGNVKVTRADWLNLARDVLVHEGVGELKILGLSTRLNVSRSSFYWYFEHRADLLAALLLEWEARSTQIISRHCAMPADDINGAVCNFFRCFVDPSLFDRGLDFGVRDWARRDEAVRHRIETADAVRLAAVQEMFARYGYPRAQADARARILYFMQIGYHVVEERESLATRLGRLEPFLKGFTGQDPTPQTIAQFTAFTDGLDLPR